MRIQTEVETFSAGGNRPGADTIGEVNWLEINLSLPAASARFSSKVFAGVHHRY
jgi:hypothetical protein